MNFGFWCCLVGADGRSTVALMTETSSIAAADAWKDDIVHLTDRVSVLVGADGGKYPSGNSVVVQGDGEAVIIDPSVTVVARGGAHVAVDAVVNSHAHEDHLAGNGLFASARVHIHEADHPGAASLEGLMDVYGLEGETRRDFSRTVVEEFNFSPRPDAEGFSDGHVFDLGGVRMEAVHLPGHTRGHSGFRIDGGVFFLSDIDLTGFGPYYGDAWSDLDDFEASIVKVRDEEAEWYVTYHHKGIIHGRDEFIEKLDGFHAVIGRRHDAMLEFLAEPRTIDEMVAHRFVYRPTAEAGVFLDSVEQRTSSLHLQRMMQRGEAEQVDDLRYQRI